MMVFNNGFEMDLEFPGEYALAYGRVGSQSDPFRVEPPIVHGQRELLVPFASVTKLVTALAVMVAAQEGILELSESVRGEAYTVSDLLSHASGLAPDGDPLAFQRATLMQPQRRRIYSNLGYEVLAVLLEEAAEMPFEAYVAEAVLQPLAMPSAHYGEQYFVPHGRGGASGLVGGILDLIALVRGVTSSGLVDRSFLEQYCRPYLPDLQGVLPGFGAMERNTWGLGPEIAGDKTPHWSCTASSPRTYGHFGRSGSLLWIDPVAELFFVSLSSEPFGPWAVSLWPRLGTEVYRQLSTSPSLDHGTDSKAD
jgi:CubicO group peptidase (beta-lactamase class C family)